MAKQSKLNPNIIVLIIVLAAVFLILRYFIQREPGQGSYVNPYEYDLSQQTKTPPELLHYRQMKQIPFPDDSLTAIAIGPDDQLFMGGKKMFKVFNRNGQRIYQEYLQSPLTCLAVSGDGIIIQGYPDQIEIIRPDFSKLDTWDFSEQKSLLTSIAIHDSDVYLADAINKWVWHYHLNGDSIGIIESTADKQGFIIPSPYFDVAIGYEGYLWAVNPGRHRMENYTAQGKLRSSWGKTSWKIDGFTGCCNPTHLAILSDGSFVTGEKGIPRVKVFDQQGVLKSVVAGAEVFHEKSTDLDLAVDSGNRIYVADGLGGVVRVFERK